MAALRACAAPPVFIPMNEVAVCVGCDVVFPLGYRRCPACGGGDVIALARWLNREESR